MKMMKTPTTTSALTGGFLTLQTHREQASHDRQGIIPTSNQHAAPKRRCAARPETGPQSNPGRLPSQGASASIAAAARRTSVSAKRGPMICSPTGRPSAVQPQGTVAAGNPVKFIGKVNANQPVGETFLPPISV